MANINLDYDLEQFKMTTQPLRIDNKFYFRDSTYKEVCDATTVVHNFIRDHPDEKIFIIYLLSGHRGHT